MVFNINNYNDLILETSKLSRDTRVSYICSNCGKEINTSLRNIRKNINLICQTCHAKQTKLEKSKDPNYKKQIQEKRKQTCLEKYGVEAITQSDLFKEKSKQTCLEKYGIEQPGQIKNAIEKRLQSNYQKYNGRENFLKHISKQVKQAWSKKTEDEIKKISAKTKETKIQKYGFEYRKRENLKSVKTRNLHYFNILNKYENDLVSFILKDEDIYFKCKKCGKEEKFKSIVLSKCDVCFPTNFRSSFGERILFEDLKKYYDDLILEDRSILTKKDFSDIFEQWGFKRPLELDILSKLNNIAIEYCGEYWHKFNHDKLSKFKHYLKQQMCEKKGIRLITLFENEYIQKKDIILSILNPNKERLFARKCKIKEISFNEVKSFLEKNHLQGVAISSVNIGLFYKNELVQIMTFSKSRFNKRYEWELLRECSKLNTIIVGGDSKLFSYFIKKYLPNSIISYCDKRFFNGESYKKIGMKFEKDTLPGYFYFNRTNNTYHNRQEFQKHKLSEILKNYNNELTELENLELNGFWRIYDCGQRIFTWKKNKS